MQENIKVSTSWHYRFRSKWLDMFKVLKIDRKLAIFLQFKEKILQLLLCSTVLQNYWVGMLKNGRDLLDQGNLKSGVFHKWFDELSRLIECFLYADSDWIIFGLTTNLLCVLDICCVSTAVAVALVKNDALFLVPTGKVLELGFP